MVAASSDGKPKKPRLASLIEQPIFCHPQHCDHCDQKPVDDIVDRAAHLAVFVNLCIVAFTFSILAMDEWMD